MNELRVKKVILLKVMEKRKRRKNKAMFVTDEGAFYKKVNSTKELRVSPQQWRDSWNFWEVCGRRRRLLLNNRGWRKSRKSFERRSGMCRISRYARRPLLKL